MGKDLTPLRYIGNETANLDYHHGGLRPVVGVQNRQVLRANRTHPELADGFGWTYNHAPNLAYWRGTFYLQYLSNPVSEHVMPGQTLLMKSTDGIRWSKPEEVFPVYTVQQDVTRTDGDVVPAGVQSVMHQRMGFYLAPNGRMLVLGFYGICKTPKDKPVDGKGIGRVAREIRPDGSFGPIYFVRYNRHAGWNESNTNYPFYTEADDPGFIEACEALLEDKLVTMQWWEEEKNPDGHYPVSGYQAFNWYKRKDGAIVGLWKHAKASLSWDEGQTWQPVEHIPSIITSGGKIWGEETSDGRYAIIYNPSPEGNHRWPLALSVSEDGKDFDKLLVVNGDIPPRRYYGAHKNYGHSYMRGFEAGDGRPNGNLWIAYSANKEDLFVSEIPVPIRDTVDEHVRDTFDQLETGGTVPNWNIYSLQWAPVAVTDYPSATDKSLMLADRDPTDYAKAMRVFPERAKIRVRFRVSAAQTTHGELHVEIQDKKGAAPVRLLIEGGRWKVLQKGDWIPVASCEAGRWYDVTIEIDAPVQRFNLSIGDEYSKRLVFTAPAFTVERLVFRTGPERRVPNTETGINSPDLEHADEPVEEAVFYVNRVETMEAD